MTKAFTCSHGCHYTAEEMEFGMSFAYMDALMTEQKFLHELNSDLEWEAELAIQHAYGELECPWPFYADDPIIIQKPEIFTV